MSNIIDKIQISGVTYDLPSGGGGNATVELTQAEYDALVSGGTVDPTILYIITDAQAGDLTNYYTKTETNTLLDGKQATLVSGTNIKTINNESILGSGNIDIQGGGSITIDPTLDSGSTNPVANSAITNNTLSGGVETNNFFRIVRFWVNNGNVAFYKRFAAINGNSVMVDGTTEAPDFSLVGTSAITTSISSSSTDAQVPSAKCVYDQFGGLKLVKLTQTEYDNLGTKDSQTLYIVTDS